MGELKLRSRFRHGTLVAAGGFFRCAHTLEETMRRFLIIGAVSAFAVTSVFSQTATEYYVVRYASSKNCTLVHPEPTAPTTKVLDNVTHKTTNEAETGLR